jgi:hypothetical protein
MIHALLWVNEAGIYRQALERTGTRSSPPCSSTTRGDFSGASRWWRWSTAPGDIEKIRPGGNQGITGPLAARIAQAIQRNIDFVSQR